MATTRSRPSRYAAEAKTGDESNVVLLGSKVIESNDGTTVSLPKETLEGLGIRPGDEMQVGYNADSRGFQYRPADKFEGW